MNILILDFERWDSGLTNYAILSASGLMARGHRVVFAGIGNMPPVNQARRKKLETVDFSNRADIVKLLKLLGRYDIEIMNPHDGGSHFLCFPAKLFRGKKLKLVRSYSDARPVKKHSLLWKQTDKFITAAEFIKRDFLENGLDSEKVKVIYQGISPDFFKGNAVEKTSSAGGFRVTILGRLDPVKGHAHFLASAAIVSEKFPGTFFRVLGDEKNVKISGLERESGKLGLKNVKFQGYVEDVASSMKASDIGVIASVGSEAVSRTALEWMASGTPLVVTDVGCLPEMVEAGRTGIVVPPGDPCAMADALCGLIENGRLRSEMGRAAFQRVKKKFSYERFITETERTFLETL
ncbi:MAG: glycosyltransferase family 4 protein [bacterium]